MGDYTQDELDLLQSLHPHVEAAVSRLLAMERSAATQVSLERSLNSLPLPLAVTTWDLELGFINSAAHNLLPLWEHGNEIGAAFKPKTPVLPLEIRDACLLIKESWSEVVRTHRMDRLKRTVQVVHPCIQGLVATIRLVEPPTGRALHPSLLIQFQTGPERPSEVANALGQLSSLTTGERAVAILAAGGHDNAEIARRLGRSTSTVRTHLRNIFGKLGITTRSRLAPLLRALEVPIPGRTDVGEESAPANSHR
ncbi:MAG: helix-turn-helix transcriptional regulator [Nibricoccus sp.]